MSLTEVQQKQHGDIKRLVEQTKAFVGRFALNKPDTLLPTGEAAAQMLDSMNGDDENYPIIPSIVAEMFDGMGDDNKMGIMRAVQHGCMKYAELNGGEQPSALKIACGLAAGKAMLDDCKKSEQMLDSLSHDNYEGKSVVPAMTIVTISNTIAYSLPLLAMLPNAIGSNELPLVYVRYVADKDHLGLKKGDYLDGPNASHQYTENRPRYKMAKVGATLEYKATCRRSYTDYADRTPDDTSAALPFKGGQVVVKVNGVPVGDDRIRNNNSRSGTHSLIAESGVVINGTAVNIASSIVDMDAHTVSVTFAAALPANAVVEANLVLDFERKDANGQHFVIVPPGVDVSQEHEVLYASSFYTQVSATQDAISQMQNELNLPYIAGALAILQQRYFLEQNVRLLIEAKNRAVWNQRLYVFDATRGVTGNVAAAYNTSRDLFSEILKYLKQARTNMTMRLGVPASGYGLYVGTTASTYFSGLPADQFTPTGNDFGMYNAIVKIGTLADGTDVYYTPEAMEIAVTNEEGDFDMLLVARSSDPAKSLFVGHMPKPPQLRQAMANIQEDVVGMHGRVCAEINPLQRFGDQSAVISVTGMYKLTEVAA
jgi:hypothetical protein